MRRVALAGLLLAVVLVEAASAGTNRDDTSGSAGIVGGTPVAVVVRGGSGELGGYLRRSRGSGARWTCGYHPLTGGSNIPGIDDGQPVDPVPGGGYAFLCHDQAGQLVHSRILRYEPGDLLSGLFAAERAAELAVERLELPVPVVVLSPPGAQLVGIPTWLWVADWETRSTAASVTGVTSTVTARPTATTWDLDDGATRTCAGPGRPYDPGRPPDGQTTDCAHTFIWPSLHPRGPRKLTATVTYAVSWSASTGAGGDLGTVTRTSTVPLTVVEVQAVGR